MGTSLNSNVASNRLVFTQEDFSGGINSVDQTMTMKDNCVKFAKNFDLTVENRLQKRKGLIYQFDRAWRNTFETNHPELGSIVRPIEGVIQAYHKFDKVNGKSTEFWVINGQIYQYPFIFSKYPNGVLHDVYNESNVKVAFKLSHTRKFDIITTQNQVIFLTGEQILEYAPYTDASGVPSDTVYQLQYIKPYQPLLEEFTNIKYGQNNLVRSEVERQHYLNVQLLGKNGFLGLMTNPNIIAPSVKPVEIIPIINQTGLNADAVMATQIVTRVIGGSDNDTSVANKNKLSTTERFAVPALWEDNSGVSVETTITNTNQLEVLGTTFNVQGNSLTHLTITPDTTKTMVAFNATAGMNLAVFKNGDAYDFYLSDVVSDVITPNASKKVITWGADQSIASISQVKTNKAGSIIVSFVKTDGTEQTQLINSTGFGIQSMEWDKTYAYGFTSKSDWLNKVKKLNDSSIAIRTSSDLSRQTTHRSIPSSLNNYVKDITLDLTNPNYDWTSTLTATIGSTFLWNEQIKSNEGSSWPMQGTWDNYGNLCKVSDVSWNYKPKETLNSDGSFSEQIEIPDAKAKIGVFQQGQCVSAGTGHLDSRTSFSADAIKFLSDPSNPNSSTTTISRVTTDSESYDYSQDQNSYDIIAGLKDALDDGTYGFKTGEVVLFNGQPLIKQINDTTFIIAMYNPNGGTSPTQVMSSDYTSREFIYWVKINVYNLMSDPVVVNDKYAATSFAYLDEGNMVYTDKEGRIWTYVVGTNTSTIVYDDTRLPFDVVVENSTHSIIAVHNETKTGSIYRIDNTNWKQPLVLWVDDPIKAINKSVADAGSYVYITDTKVKRTTNWKQAYGIDFKFSSGSYTLLAAWETSLNNYSFVVLDDSGNRYYATSSVQAPTYPTYGRSYNSQGAHNVGDEVTAFSTGIKERKNYLIDWIQFGKTGSDVANDDLNRTTPPSGGDPGVTLSIQGKFPDYDDYVELFTVDYNDSQYHPEFQYLMYEFEDIKVFIKQRDTATTVQDITIFVGTVSSAEDTTSQLSRYETIWTPQLTPANASQNINYIHECTKGYYKNGYLMVYGSDPDNLSNAGNTIFISDVNRPNYFPQFNTIDIATEGAESIQKIATWNSQLENVVFMENSIYYLKFSSPTDVELRIITDSIGLSAPDSVANAANKLFFVSYKGVYALTNTSFATDGNANYTLMSEKIAPLMLNDEGVIDSESIGYIQDNNYYLIVPNVLNYDIHENAITVFRRFKYYTATGKQCWYMDESPYFDISVVYQRQGKTSYIMYSAANVLQDFKEEYVDGDLDGYTDCIPDTIDPNTEITYPDDPTFYIYGAELQTKGYATDYRKHTKNFRKALVEIGLGKQNVNLGIGSEIDGYTKVDPTEVTSVYRNGQYHLEKNIVANFTTNAGTFIGTLKEKGTFVWNVSKWGWKKSHLTMVSSYKRGITMSILIKQIANEATPYQIITVGFEYRVRNLRKQS